MSENSAVGSMCCPVRLFTTGDATVKADRPLSPRSRGPDPSKTRRQQFEAVSVIRDGMGHNGQRTRDEGILDIVITNAIIIDHTVRLQGRRRAIRDGVISAIGAAGNLDIMDDIDIVIGTSTEVIAGESTVSRRPGHDSHIHFISPTQVATALPRRVTTMTGGGRPKPMAPTLPRHARGLEPACMPAAVEDFPMNNIIVCRLGGHASPPGSCRSSSCAPECRLQDPRGLGRYTRGHRRGALQGRRRARRGRSPSTPTLSTSAARGRDTRRYR